MNDRYEPKEDVGDEVRERRARFAQVAVDTIAITKVGEYATPSGARVDIAARVDACVSGTRVIADALPIIARARDAATGSARRTVEVSVDVTSEKTGECARRLVREGARRVAMLNFANGVRVGGGFLYGARAQ